MMLLSPSKMKLSINTFSLGLEKPTQKELTIAKDKHCFDNAFQAFLTTDSENKST